MTKVSAIAASLSWGCDSGHRNREQGPGVRARQTQQGQSTMGLFTVLDVIALAGFVVAWGGYSILIDWTPHGRVGLNARMNGYREMWMRRMLARDNRMVDTMIMSALQNGTAF